MVQRSKGAGCICFWLTGLPRSHITEIYIAGDVGSLLLTVLEAIRANVELDYLQRPPDEVQAAAKGIYNNNPARCSRKMATHCLQQ